MILSLFEAEKNKKWQILAKNEKITEYSKMKKNEKITSLDSLLSSVPNCVNLLSQSKYAD